MSPKARIAAGVVLMLLLFGGMQVRESGQRDRLIQSYEEALLALSKGYAPAPELLTDEAPDDLTAKLLWIQVRAEEEVRAGADSALAAQGIDGFDPPPAWMTAAYLRDAGSYPQVGRHWEAYNRFHSGYAASIPDLTRAAVSRWGIVADLRPAHTDQVMTAIETDMPRRMRRFDVRAQIASAALDLHRALAESGGRAVQTRDGGFEFDDARAASAYNTYLPRISSAHREIAVFDGQLSAAQEKMMSAPTATTSGPTATTSGSTTVTETREDGRRRLDEARQTAAMPGYRTAAEVREDVRRQLDEAARRTTDNRRARE